MTGPARLVVLAALLSVTLAAPPGRVRAAPQGVPSAEQFAANCSRLHGLLPASVALDTAEAVIGDRAPWRSPTSTTSPRGEQVRATFCRLSGTIDGDIGFEIWLPRDWNSRLLGAGVGGEAGYFNFADMARGVEQGFVAASSDAGHKRGERWIDIPRKAETYSHLAYHRLTEVAKEVSGRFYGETPAHSYFIGCSGGGRQGLRELQLYPGDYDGALVGAPGLDVPLLAARLLHVHLAQTRKPGAELTSDDWNLIARSATAQCDAADGVTDGVIADPRTCTFRVRQLTCKNDETEGCLSPDKVTTAEAIIAPLADARGTTYDYGLLPGITSRPGGLPPLPVQMFGDVVHGDSAWNPRSFEISRDLAAARAAFPMMDARSANLADFAARGGKLMLYHGWADASVQPLSTIDFFSRLQPAPTGAGDDVARLYMVPGMQHCRGGAGTDRFGASEDRTPTAEPRSDMLAALVGWVERQVPPGPIIARRLDDRGAVDRTRPLCPFPAQAVYRGSGNVDEAGSFACVQATSLSSRL